MKAFVTFCPFVADLSHFAVFESRSFERVILVVVAVVAVEVVLVDDVVPSENKPELFVSIICAEPTCMRGRRMRKRGHF